MKKHLSQICLGLLATSLTMSAYAQQPEDVTYKLENPSFEYATSNWNVDIFPDADAKATMWVSSQKGQEKLLRYFGFHNGCISVWKPTTAENPTFVGNNGFSQTLTDLPNGTYVFGVYGVAADQSAEIPYLGELEGLSGVNLFANENQTPMATEDPEGDTLQALTHARKFNVAAEVLDGTLKVGVSTESATVNYIAVDEATLYFFGDMPAEDALVAMRKIDLQETLEIADTCMNGKWAMCKDSLDLLTTAYNDAKPYVAATATTDEMELEEKWTELRNRIMWANKSINDYRSVKRALLDADTLLMTEEGWFELATAEGAVEKLNDSIALCRTIMEEQTSDRPTIVTHRVGLREAMAAVRVYELMNAQEEVLQTFLDTAGFSVDADEAGKYSLLQKRQLTDLQEEIAMSYDAYTGGELTARELIEFTPKIQETIDNIVAMGKLEYNHFPILLDGSKDGMLANTGEKKNLGKQMEWKTKTFMFNSEVHLLRFSVMGTNKNQKSGPFPFFTLAEMTITDKNGKTFDINPENYESYVTTNAQEPWEGPLVNLFDGKTDNFFTTTWSGAGPSEPHYLEITLPEGEYDYTGFSIGFVTRADGWHTPTTVELSTTASQAMIDLRAAVNSIPLAHEGVEPGYFTTDLTPLREAVAHANDLIANGGTDEECNAARMTLEEASKAISIEKINLPVAGKEYRLISSLGKFFDHQNVVKAMVAHADSLVWWETAAADSTDQLFTFERIPVDSMLMYRVKNVATQKYMVCGDDQVLLRDAPLEGENDTVMLSFTGNHQFTFYFADHAGFAGGDHNNGIPEASEGAFGVGGQKGITSGLCFWEGNVPDEGSSWFVREMHELPLTALLQSGEQSINYHLYEGLTLMSFSTKEACDFKNFKLYDNEGDTIACTLSRLSNSITALLEKPVESFSFAFDHSSAVEVTVSTDAPAPLELQRVYNEAVLLNPVEGNNIYQYTDLTAYNAALENAEKVLEEGGSEDVVLSAIAAINKAVEELKPNMPDPEKEYFILTGYESFVNHHKNPVAMFYNPEIGYPAWTLLQKNNVEYLWTFTEVPPVATDPEGTPTKYYIKNSASGDYLTENDVVSLSPEATSAYRLEQLKDDVLAIVGSMGRVHGAGHSGGRGAFGNLVHYGTGLNSSSSWKICEADAIITDVDFTEIDTEDTTVKEGIFDLTGRKVLTPEKGLYIINGKKVYIK